MRSIGSVALAFLVTLGPAAAAAERPKVEINGGVALPTNPDGFSEPYNVGFGGGIGVELPVTRAVRLIGRVELTNYGLCRREYAKLVDLPETTPVDGGERSITYLSGTLLWNLSPATSVQPYVVAGAGYFHLETDDICLAGETVRFETQGVTGVHGGGGVNIGMGSALNLFVEVIYVVGLTDDHATSYVPFRAGISVDLSRSS